MDLPNDIGSYDDKDLFSGLDLSEETPLQKKEGEGAVMVPTQNYRKISTDVGTAQIWIEDDSISITRGESGVCVNKDGVVFVGKIHMTKNLEENRVSGFWTWNPELLTCLPSTLYTPIPTLTYSNPPYAKQAKALMSLVG